MNPNQQPTIVQRSLVRVPLLRIVVVTAAPTASSTAAKASGLVLLTLASAQFVMALDMTVMNTAIATVARDVGTDEIAEEGRYERLDGGERWRRSATVFAAADREDATAARPAVKAV